MAVIRRLLTHLLKREMISMCEKWKMNKSDRPEGVRLPSVRPGMVTNTKEDLKSSTDIYGSYTGVPLDGGKPVQDVDDL